MESGTWFMRWGGTGTCKNEHGRLAAHSDFQIQKFPFLSAGGVSSGVKHARRLAVISEGDSEGQARGAARALSQKHVALAQKWELLGSATALIPVTFYLEMDMIDRGARRNRKRFRRTRQASSKHFVHRSELGMTELDHLHPVVRIRATGVGKHHGQVRHGTEASTLPCGFMMLLDRKSGKPFSLVNLFLLEEGVRGRPNQSLWDKTQKNYADDMANWVAFLCFRGKDAGDANWDDIDQYGNILASEISPNTLQKYDSDTQRRRLGTVIAFYEWAFNRGHLLRVVPARQKRSFRRVSIPDAPIESAQDLVKNLLPPKIPPGEKVRLVPRGALRNALAWGGCDVTIRLPGAGSSRNRTVWESAFATAARVDELASISVYEVLDLQGELDLSDPRQLLKVTARRSKGKPSRQLLVPQRMLQKWLAYARGERAEVCRRVRDIHGTDRYIADTLFISLSTATATNIGSAMTADTMSRTLSKAFIATGHVKTGTRAALDATGLPLVDSHGRLKIEEFLLAANTIHDLRHTYVVVMYHAMKRGGIRNPWKQISRALGHATVEMTIDTYGRHVEIDESGLMDAMDSELYDLDTWAEGIREW